MLQLSQTTLSDLFCWNWKMFHLAQDKSKMFEECVCFKCAYKNVNASISLAQPVCKCEHGFLASNIKRMKIDIVKLLTFQRFKGLFTTGFIASCKHNSNTLLRQLADNLEAYPFVCSCHHCHCVFGPPPETISLSKMLPREHTTNRTYPRKNWDCQITPSILSIYEHFRSDKNAARTSQREKGIPLKTITWRNNKYICKSASRSSN